MKRFSCAYEKGQSGCVMHFLQYFHFEKNTFTNSQLQSTAVLKLLSSIHYSYSHWRQFLLLFVPSISYTSSKRKRMHINWNGKQKRLPSCRKEKSRLVSCPLYLHATLIAKDTHESLLPVALLHLFIVNLTVQKIVFLYQLTFKVFKRYNRLQILWCLVFGTALLKYVLVGCCLQI